MKTARTNTHLFGIVDTLQITGCYVGAVKGFPHILFVACEDMFLQVCTHRIRLIPPAGEKRGTE